MLTQTGDKKEIYFFAQNTFIIENLQIFFSEYESFKWLQFSDLVQLQTIKINLGKKSNNLPQNVQKIFTQKESRYKLRGNLNFKVTTVQSKRTSFCVSIQW